MQRLEDYADPGLGRWNPQPPPAPGPALTPAEIEWLKSLREFFCPQSEVFQEQLNKMLVERGGQTPSNLLQVLHLIEGVPNKMEPCDRSDILPREEHNLAPPPPPQQDPGLMLPPAPIRLPQPPQQPVPNPFALERQPATRSPAAAPVPTRLRAVLLAGQAQRRKEAATGAPFAAEAPKVRDGASLQQSVHFYRQVPGEEPLKKAVTTVVLLKKNQTGPGKMDFELEMASDSKYAMKITLVDLMTVPVYRSPRGKPTPHTLVYTGDRQMASPPSESIVATRNEKEERWRFDDMVETIQKHLTAFAKGDLNTFKPFNVYIQCPCIY